MPYNPAMDRAGLVSGVRNRQRQVDNSTYRPSPVRVGASVPSTARPRIASQAPRVPGGAVPRPRTNVVGSAPAGLDISVATGAPTTSAPSPSAPNTALPRTPDLLAKIQQALASVSGIPFSGYDESQRSNFLSLLSPNLADAVTSGRMNIGGALNRVLQRLNGQLPGQLGGQPNLMDDMIPYRAAPSDPLTVGGSDYFGEVSSPLLSLLANSGSAQPGENRVLNRDAMIDPTTGRAIGRNPNTNTFDVGRPPMPSVPIPAQGGTIGASAQINPAIAQWLFRVLGGAQGGAY
jgi:hypothetical protein